MNVPGRGAAGGHRIQQESRDGNDAGWAKEFGELKAYLEAA